MIEHPVVDKEEWNALSNRERRERYFKLEVTVPVRLMWVDHGDGEASGSLVFKCFTTDVYDDDDNQIGAIGGGTGAVTLSAKAIEAKGEWMIWHDDLWYAFMEAVEKENARNKESE